MKISKSSWHYSLASTGNFCLREGQTISICEYIREVFKGFLLVAFGCILLSIMGFCVITPFLKIAIYLETGVFLLPEVNIIDMGFFITSTFIFIYICSVSFEAFVKWISSKVNKPRRSNVIENEPGFLSMVFDSIKNKICFNLTVEE